MPTLLIYLLQSSLALTILYGVYWAILRKVTFYELNRIILLLIISGSLLLPSLQVSLPTPTIKHWISILDKSFSNPNDQLQPTSKISLSGSNPSATRMPMTEAFDKGQAVIYETFPGANSYSITWLVCTGLLGLYLVVVVFFLGRIFFELFAVFTLAKTGKRQWVNSCTVIYTKECSAPLSFFKAIVLNPDLFTPTQLEQIIRHERVHARQWHSLDVLLVELFGAFFWFHPMAYLLKREIKLNLEYIADKQVLQQGFNRKIYQYNLLQISSPTAPIPVANYFTFSYLKSRIRQMNANPSSRQALWCYGSLLPAIALLLFAIQPMNAAQNESGQTASKPLANALDTTSAVLDQPGIGLVPNKGQPTHTESNIQILDRNDTVSSHSGGKEATSAEPVAQSQPSGRLSYIKPISEKDMPLMVKSVNNLPINVNYDGVSVGSSLIHPSQTTKASALNPYLNLDTSHNIYLAIRASLDENALQMITQTLQEKGVQVTFSNVRYNAQSQLTRIRMRVSIGNCKEGGACFEQTIEAYNDGEALQNDKPLVFYLSRRADRVGVYFGYPEDLPLNDITALHNFTGTIVGIYGAN